MHMCGNPVLGVVVLWSTVVSPVLFAVRVDILNYHCYTFTVLLGVLYSIVE